MERVEELKKKLKDKSAYSGIMKGERFWEGS